jgi:predicted enzyme related to lactoylglutathione lyase
MGKIIHFEIPSDNLEKSLQFYSKIFGWKLQDTQGSDYWLVETGPRENYGINGAITKRDASLKTVANTIHVDNIKEAISAINANGGVVLTDIMDIPNVGRFIHFKDPDGNIMGALEIHMQSDN